MSKQEQNYDVFLSYSHHDSELARKLTEALSGKGVKVFNPESEIHFGDSIKDRLDDALEHSKYFILLISPEYISSPWANFEMGVALSRVTSAGERRVLPIITKEIDFKSVPFALSNIAALQAKEHSPDEIAAKLSAVIEMDKP